jgi:ssDNA-binding Zn-finger/Zn-ribbon topoisomerase 1
MKNIHLLSTDKPIKNVGDLVKDKYGDIHIFTKNDGKEYGKTTTKINIYITSDEEIKEGDYYITPNNTVLKALGPMLINVEDYKKIILTTDQELIKDGVQAIDDTFLEWFVKNPSCEYVDIKRNYLGSKCLKCGFIENHDKVDTEDCPKCHNTTYEHLYNNKIIIPKEEPKDVVLGYKTSLDAQMLDKVKPKQETLEEDAKKYAELSYYNGDEVNAFVNGVKWKAERMYSEEEVKLLVNKAMCYVRNDNPKITLKELKEWFEQFKKK